MHHPRHVRRTHGHGSCTSLKRFLVSTERPQECLVPAQPAHQGGALGFVQGPLQLQSELVGKLGFLLPGSEVLLRVVEPRELLHASGVA